MIRVIARSRGYVSARQRRVCVAAAEMSASASGVSQRGGGRRHCAAQTRLASATKSPTRRSRLQRWPSLCSASSLRGRVLVVIRELDDRSAEGAVLEQLEGERSDTSSNVKAGSGADAHERLQLKVSRAVSGRRPRRL